MIINKKCFFSRQKGENFTRFEVVIEALWIRFFAHVTKWWRMWAQPFWRIHLSPFYIYNKKVTENEFIKIGLRTRYRASVFGQKFGNFRVRLFWTRPQRTDLSLLNNLSICVLNEMRITDGKPGVSENAWVYITSRCEWNGRCYPMIFVLLLFSNWKDFSSGP